MSTEVRMLNVCRTLEGTGAQSILDEFDTIGANWSDAGTWTLDGVATSGLPVATGGTAINSAYNVLNTARFANQALSLSALREVWLAFPLFALPDAGASSGGEISILMDMDGTTPVPAAASVRMRVWLERNVQGEYFYEVFLFVNEGTAVANINRPWPGSLNQIGLTIDGSGTIRCYTESASDPIITYRPNGYAPASTQTRVGFALKSTTNFKTWVHSFTLRYTPANAAGLLVTDLPSEALVSSANGLIYVQKKDGSMAVLGTAGVVVRTLASDRLLSSTPWLQKIYIADYALRRYALTGQNTGAAFSDSAFSAFDTLGLGSDVIVNGAFTADTDWTKGAGWTIGAGVATATGAISTDLSQTVAPLTVGKKYRVTFTITVTGGSITPVCGTTNGSVVSSGGTYTQDIFCTDNGGFKFTTSGFTGTVDNVSARENTNAIDMDDDRLEIISGTTAPTGVYDITNITAATLTLSPAPDINGSDLQYRIVRAPKVFDSSTMALTKVPLGSVPTGTPPNRAAVSPGQFPHGCTIVAAWNDTLIWTGDPLFPHVAYKSKAGDETGYLYFNEMEGEAFAFDPARVAGASQLGMPITAVIPHSHDYVLFAGRQAFVVQKGDPTINGTLELISRNIGIIGPAAWCYTPEQVVCGLSTDGIYVFQPDPRVTPLRVSRERLPSELLNINPDLYDVQLAYDIIEQGIDIFLTPKIAAPTTHWWFDWGKKAFWPKSFQQHQDPTAVVNHTIDGTPHVILGCRDGYLRRSERLQADDDGYTLSSKAILGPFMTGSPSLMGLLLRLWLELDQQSGVVTVEVLMGDTPAKARNALAAYGFNLSQLGDAIGPNTEIVRAAGGAFFLRLTATQPWALESGQFEREITGERRNP